MNLLLSQNIFLTILYVIIALLVLLAMITIHELGHYIAGKIFKFKINEFSIGLGPVLGLKYWSVKEHKFKQLFRLQWTLKSGELFSIRLLPLGGYCAFAGEDGEEEEKNVKKPFIELTEKSESENEVATEVVAPRDTSGDFTNKKPWQRIIVLVAGAFMNYILALLIIIISMGCYGQSYLKIGGMSTAEAGYEIYNEYSLQTGDIISQIDGKEMYLTTNIMSALDGKKAGDIVKVGVYRTNVESGKLELVEVDVMLRKDAKFKNMTDNSTICKVFGVGAVYNEDGSGYWLISSTNVRKGFFQTIGSSFMYSFAVSGSIFRVLGELITGVLGLNAVGGTVTTIALTTEVIALGFASFLQIVALIGVNLAVLNLLPIPALDGSRVVFTAIEWIFKKPVNRKVEALIHTVGIVLLLGFSILVDLLHLFN